MCRVEQQLSVQEWAANKRLTNSYVSKLVIPSPGKLRGREYMLHDLYHVDFQW